MTNKLTNKDIDNMIVHLFLQLHFDLAAEGIAIQDRPENKRLAAVLAEATGATADSPLAKLLYTFAAGMWAAGNNLLQADE